MGEVEVTSMSSRGQVVIPQHLRETMNLDSGAKFVVIGEGDTIVLKRLGMPEFRGFEKLVRKTHKWAKNKDLRPLDVQEARNRI